MPSTAAAGARLSESGNVFDSRGDVGTVGGALDVDPNVPPAPAGRLDADGDFMCDDAPDAGDEPLPLVGFEKPDSVRRCPNARDDLLPWCCVQPA